MGKRERIVCESFESVFEYYLCFCNNFNVNIVVYKYILYNLKCE